MSMIWENEGMNDWPLPTIHQDTKLTAKCLKSLTECEFAARFVPRPISLHIEGEVTRMGGDIRRAGILVERLVSACAKIQDHGLLGLIYDRGLRQIENKCGVEIHSVEYR